MIGPFHQRTGAGMPSHADTDETWLYLVRHGATEANERTPYILQGNSIDLPLSGTGQKQAQAVAAFLHPFKIRRVYSSAMIRARQTAEAIASAVGAPLAVE